MDENFFLKNETDVSANCWFVRGTPTPWACQVKLRAGFTPVRFWSAATVLNSHRIEQCECSIASENNLS